MYGPLKSIMERLHSIYASLNFDRPGKNLRNAHSKVEQVPLIFSGIVESFLVFKLAKQTKTYYDVNNLAVRPTL